MGQFSWKQSCFSTRRMLLRRWIPMTKLLTPSSDTETIFLDKFTPCTWAHMCWVRKFWCLATIQKVGGAETCNNRLLWVWHQLDTEWASERHCNIRWIGLWLAFEKKQKCCCLLIVLTLIQTRETYVVGHTVGERVHYPFALPHWLLYATPAPPNNQWQIMSDEFPFENFLVKGILMTYVCYDQEKSLFQMQIKFTIIPITHEINHLPGNFKCFNMYHSGVTGPCDKNGSRWVKGTQAQSPLRAATNKPYNKAILQNASWWLKGHQSQSAIWAPCYAL